MGGRGSSKWAGLRCFSQATSTELGKKQSAMRRVALHALPTLDPLFLGGNSDHSDILGAPMY